MAPKSSGVAIAFQQGLGGLGRVPVAMEARFREAYRPGGEEDFFPSVFCELFNAGERGVSSETVNEPSFKGIGLKVRVASPMATRRYRIWSSLRPKSVIMLRVTYEVDMASRTKASLWRMVYMAGRSTSRT